MTLELNPNELWLTPAQVSRVAGRTVRTVATWLGNGLASSGTGKARRVRLDKLILWAAKHLPSLSLPRSESELKAALQQ